MSDEPLEWPQYQSEGERWIGNGMCDTSELLQEGISSTNYTVKEESSEHPANTVEHPANTVEHGHLHEPSNNTSVIRTFCFVLQFLPLDRPHDQLLSMCEQQWSSMNDQNVSGGLFGQWQLGTFTSGCGHFIIYCLIAEGDVLDL